MSAGSDHEMALYFSSQEAEDDRTRLQQQHEEDPANGPANGKSDYVLFSASSISSKKRKESMRRATDRRLTSSRNGVEVTPREVDPPGEMEEKLIGAAEGDASPADIVAEAPEDDGDYVLTAFDLKYQSSKYFREEAAARGVEGDDGDGPEGAGLSTHTATRRRAQTMTREAEESETSAVVVVADLCRFTVLPVALMAGVAVDGGYLSIGYLAAFAGFMAAPKAALGAGPLHVAVGPNVVSIVFAVIVALAHIAVDVLLQVLCDRGEPVSPDLVQYLFAPDADGSCGVPARNIWPASLILSSGLVSIIAHFALRSRRHSSLVPYISPSGFIRCAAQLLSPEAVSAILVAAAAQSESGVAEIPMVIYAVFMCVALVCPERHRFFSLAQRVVGALMHVVLFYTVALLMFFITLRLRMSTDEATTTSVHLFSGMSARKGQRGPILLHCVAAFATLVAIVSRKHLAHTPQQLPWIYVLNSWILALYTPVSSILILALMLIAPSAIGCVWFAVWFFQLAAPRSMTTMLPVPILGTLTWLGVFVGAFPAMESHLHILHLLGARSMIQDVDSEQHAGVVLATAAWTVAAMRQLRYSESLRGTDENDYVLMETGILRESASAAKVSARLDMLRARASRIGGWFQHYFVVITFATLFLAAVVRVNILHFVFLALFIFVFLAKRCPPRLWLVVTLYTAMLNFLMYGMYAFAPEDSTLLQLLGFVESSEVVLALVPYFMCTVVFVYQYTCYGHSQMSNMSDSWSFFLRGLEGTSIGIVWLLVAILLAAVVAMEQASLMAVGYTILFVAFTSTLFYSSFECPPSPVVYFVQFVLLPFKAIFVAASYVAALGGEKIQEQINDRLVGTRFTAANLGLSQSRSVSSLWPKLASMMLLIVLCRAWRRSLNSAAALRRARESTTAAAGSGGGFATAADEAQSRSSATARSSGAGAEATDRGAAWRIFQFITALTLEMQMLCALYSQALAIGALFLAATYTPAGLTPTAVQGLYYLAGSMASIASMVRRSHGFWRSVQVFTGLWILAISVTQLPIVIHNAASLPSMLVYVGVFPPMGTAMWPLLCNHMLLFGMVGLHSNFMSNTVTTREVAARAARERAYTVANTRSSGASADRPTSLQPSAASFVAPSNGMTSTPESFDARSPRNGTGESAGDTTDADGHGPSVAAVVRDATVHSALAAAQMLQKVVISVSGHLRTPMTHLRRVGYHATLLCLVVTARVFYYNIYGPTFLVMACVVGSLGKHKATTSYRWLALVVIVGALSLLTFFLRLGYPNDDGYVNGFLNRSLSEQEIDYLSVNPTEALVMWCTVSWLFVIAEWHALSSYAHSHWLRGRQGVVGLTVADRLVAYADVIRVARATSDAATLESVLPRPKNRKDFTSSASATDGAGGSNNAVSRSLKKMMFTYFKALVLTVAFVHAVYDTATSIDVLKILSQVMAMAFFQNYGALAWHGYRWWTYYLRFHCVWMFGRLVVYIPGLSFNNQGICALKVMGLLPATDNTPSYVANALATLGTCPGTKYSGSDLAFHTLVIVLIWWQTVLYTKSDYSFVLHSLFNEEVSAASLGRAIAAFRLHSARATKLRRQQQESDRLRVLHKMFEVRTEKFDNADGSPSKIRSVNDSIDGDSSPVSTPGSAVLVQPPSPPLPAMPLPASTLRHLATIEASMPASVRSQHPSYRLAIERELLRLAEIAPEMSGVFEENDDFDAKNIALLAGAAVGGDEDASDSDDNGKRRSKSQAQRPKRRYQKGVIAATRRLWIFLREYIDAAILWLDSRSLGMSTQRLTRRHLAKSGRLWPLATTLYRFLMSYTSGLVFLMFCVQFSLSPSLLTAVLPMSVFVYAATMAPRPHIRYWQACIAYLQVMIIIKTVLKVTLCAASNEVVDGVRLRDSSANVASPLHGRTCYPRGFLVDALVSLFCILLVVVHVSHLRRWGLWNDTELYVNHDAPVSTGGGLLIGIKDAVRNIGRRDIKVGADFYKVGFAIDIVSILFIFFAYYKLTGSGDDFVASLQSSILPGMLAVVLIMFIASLIADRVIFLQRSLNAKFIYSCVLACLVHGTMIWWYVTQTQFVNAYYGDVPFNIRDTLPLAIVLYIMRCLYLFASCAQVRDGYCENDQHLSFSGNYGVLELTLYRAARLTPFVYDLKVLLDWTVLPTALKLPYWIKLEDIMHEVYQVLCDRQDTVDIERMKKHASSPFPRIVKVPVGATMFSLLTFILVFPLLLYSSFSPALKSNGITSVDMQFGIESVPTFWSASNIKLTPMAGGITLNSSVVSLIQKTRPSLIGEGLTTDNVQMFLLSNYSATLWHITPPAFDQLMRQLNGTRDLHFSIAITVTNAVNVITPTLTYTQTHLMTPELRKGFYALITGGTSRLHIPGLFTPFFQNKGGNELRPIGNQQDNSETCVLYRERLSDFRGDYFGMSCSTLFAHSNPSASDWADLSRSEWRCVRGGACDSVEEASARANYTSSNVFVVISSGVVLNAGFLQSIGIVAAYSTFVLAIGRVIRFALSGSAFRTAVEDMEDPTYLVCLLEYIMIVRRRRQFVLEGQLFKELVDTLRDTSTLERKTRYKPKQD